MQTNKIALFISPHPDDVEIGCGGTVTKYVRDGWTVRVFILSTRTPDKVDLATDCQESLNSLGVKALTFSRFEIRFFSKRREDILQTMIDVRKEYKPDHVFIPSGSNKHQDHVVVFEEARRAFLSLSSFPCSVLCYEQWWNDIPAFNPNYYVPLSELDLSQKIRAISFYKSQSKRLYTKPKAIETALRFRGMQIGYEFAEAFEVIRWIQ